MSLFVALGLAAFLLGTPPLPGGAAGAHKPCLFFKDGRVVELSGSGSRATGHIFWLRNERGPGGGPQDVDERHPVGLSDAPVKSPASPPRTAAAPARGHRGRHQASASSAAM